MWVYLGSSSGSLFISFGLNLLYCKLSLHLFLFNVQCVLVKIVGFVLVVDRLMLGDLFSWLETCVVNMVISL